MQLTHRLQPMRLPAVQDVVRVNDFELDVTVSSGAPYKGPIVTPLIMSCLRRAFCVLVLPDAWVDAEVVAFDGNSAEDLAASSEEVAAAEEEAVAEGGNASEGGDYFDTVTVSTTLHNADVSVEENTAVSVLATDGTYKEVKAVQTQVNPDGVDRTFNVQDLRDAAYGNADEQPQANDGDAGEGLEDKIALARSAAESDMVVLSVDAPAVASAYGGADQDPHPEVMFVALKSAAMPRTPLAASATSAAFSSVAAETSGSPVVSGLFDKAKGMLGPLASAWERRTRRFLPIRRSAML
ncbi:MAG: hypothetical protein ACLTQI_08470 [Slackia sp.]